MNKKILVSSSFALIGFLTMSSLAIAQDVTNATNTGYPENAIIHGTEIESVQVSNGNLHVQIPIWSAKGRGLNTSGQLVYDNKEWFLKNQCFSSGICTDTTTAEPGNNMVITAHSTKDYNLTWKNASQQCSGTIYSYLTTNVVLREPNGTKHHFSPDPVAYPGETVCGTAVASVLYANDGSGWTVKLDSVGTPLYAISKDGTKGGLEDSNGNQVTSTDTLGRTIYGGLTYVDSSGAQRSATISSTTSVTYATQLCLFSTADQCFDPSGTWTVPASITLPNGMQYSFTYAQGQGAEIASITLPTGGQISYTYGPWQMGGRPVATRAVTANGVTGTWTYTITGGTSAPLTTVTDPYSNDTTYDCSAAIFDNPCFTKTVKYYSGSRTAGTLLKTELTDYTTVHLGQLISNYITVPIRITTTWNTANQVAKIETDWDTATVAGGTTTWKNVLEKREFAYATGASGSLVRRTHYNYLHLQNINYLAVNIADRITSEIVYDSAGTITAQTTTAYDASTLSPTSGVPNHDYTNFPSTNLVRGNPTTISRWLNPGNTWVNTNKTYDDLGNLLSTTDPLSHTTQYSYSDSWANASCVAAGATTYAYVTQVINQLGQHAQSSYYPCTGLVASSKDQNDINAGRVGTTRTYDLMGRLSQLNASDGGQHSFSYNDVAPVSFTSTKSINTLLNVVSTTVLDGMGRTKQTQLTSDPQGTVFTDTVYDKLGRVSTVSNPYRSGADITTTTGITTYGYDALSRKTSESLPDGSALSTAYCGPETLVTDPTLRWRRSRTDALGRLVEVDEPNVVSASVNPSGCPGTGEPIWVTSYTYDVLDDLTQVVQNGSRQRNFTYDSLSHLLAASNPESGTINYSYNNDGVLISKRDARSITICLGTWSGTSCDGSGVDPLHRTTKLSYSNSDPTVTFVYDVANCLGLLSCDNVGHRTSMTDAAGSESWAFQIDPANHRSVHKDQRTTNGISKTATYYLDLVGNVTQLAYPTGRTVNYSFDAANRPSNGIDSSNGITYATGFKTWPGGTCIASITCYTPQGTFYALSIGQTSTFTGLNLTHMYNNRLQPLRFQASTGGSTIDITYSFVDPANNHNAGRVFSITNNIDGTRSQTFTYDQLNRITSALTTSTYATSPSHCWGETYQYDGVANGAWGNLTQITATTNATYTGCTQESGFTKTVDGNNHLSSFSYDLAGNTAGDGVNSYTWNAESQLKVTAGVTYLYDGDGRRVAKANTAVPPVPYKLYWYGSDGEILAETDGAGNTNNSSFNEYIFFGGKRVAMITNGGEPTYYVEDLLGTSRVLTTNAGTVCYDADFYPYGVERTPYTSTCTQNAYKFEGKERDTETGNDDFGARYYSNRFGRWLSADWSSVPSPVPYANLSNPQTLNLYAIVADDPESFADLDGHAGDDDIVDHILNFVVSAGATFLSDNALGAFRPNPQTVEGKLGQALGDVAAQYSGASEAEAGVAGRTDALVLAVAGQEEAAPEVAAASQIMIVHGAATAAVATANIAKSGLEPGSRPGKDFTPSGEKAIDARDGNKCQNCGRDVQSVQNKKGQPTPANQRQRHHIEPKSRGGSGTPENGKTLCPGCHKEEHRKLRQKKPNEN